MAVKDQVEKRVEKAKHEAKEGVKTAVHMAEVMSGNLHKNIAAVAEFMDDREIALTLRFNKLTVDGEICKTLSFTKKPKK
jgi:N-acetylglucosamine-6-phosphate deacetylase